jgi:ADP-ribose pyrophosphatase YjhB (NUDIX family)
MCSTRSNVRIPDDQWRSIEKLIPITCVDVLLWTRQEGPEPRLGLIRRLNEAGSLAWNLVGGRVLLDETIEQALRRHIVETVGPDISWSRTDFRQPVIVGEYLRSRVDGYGFDPRHHAVALAYTLECTGKVAVGGEAVEFEFFAPDALPTPAEIGFAQDAVIYRLVEHALSEAAN